MSYLPGMKLKVLHTDVCEEGDCFKKAVLKIVNEVDSFGYETFCMCEEHAAEYENEKKEEEHQEQQCDWCFSMRRDVIPFRDWEEGSNGPVYEVCPDCRRANNESAASLFEDEED